MKRKLFTLNRRSVRNGLLAAAALALLMAVVYWQNVNLINSNFTTGYVLLGCVVFLASFNLRKKFPMLPFMGSAAFWMQLHIYVGLSTFAIFGLHIAWRIPNGWFESFLALLYVLVALSGVYGLWMTRILPRRLTAIPEEIVFERIPWLRLDLARQARELVLTACESTDVLARFYASRLSQYLEQPRNFVYLVQPNGRLRRQMIAEIDELDRFLAEDQRPASRGLAELVKRKDDLDYHSAVQGRLKVWLFVHIGLTYSLLVVAIMHVVLVHAFSGGFQ